MKLKKFIIFFILSVCRLFLVFAKQDERKVTFISLESSRLEGDFKLISDELQEMENYSLHYILVKFEKSIVGNIKYFFSCIKQLHAVYTSRLIVLDYNNYVVSNFKKDTVKVLQLWHASGAIKKFGNDTSRDYVISGYDYVIANCAYFVAPFARAFGVSVDRIKVTGIPKTDRLFKPKMIARDRAWMYKNYPQIVGKKVVLYAPTFRGKLMHSLANTTMDLQRVQSALGDGFVVLYKMHPLLDDVVIAQGEHVICCNGRTIRKLFSIADYLISDYSAIIIDFSVYEKPMLFYTPDLEEYRKDVGFYVDYEKDMPGPICKSEEDVIQAIQSNDFSMEDIKAFKDTFFAHQDGHSCARVVALIEEIMEGAL